LSLKKVLQFRSQSTSPIPAVKVNAELPSEDILLQIPLIIQDLTLAFQVLSRVLINDVPYGEIIEILDYDTVGQDDAMVSSSNSWIRAADRRFNDAGNLGFIFFENFG
jgi:hypothetical protein